jgi:hypothetical protein
MPKRKRKSGQERGIERARRDRELQRTRNLIQLSEQREQATRTQADRLGVDPVTQQLKHSR